ncbi:MAG: hypothetical protein GX616_26175 [Planctomycetes bacterium]|nr:hypothetical protein [Planctomycetota bacterium]
MQVETKTEVDRDAAQAELCVVAQQRSERTGKPFGLCMCEVARDYRDLADVAAGRAELRQGETIQSLLRQPVNDKLAALTARL